MSRFSETVAPSRLGKPFRWLLASSWTTNLGDGIAVAAGPLLVASLTDDAFLVSMAALLGWAPPLLFGLYAGALSDRLDRRRLVIVADGSRAVILAGLIATMATGTVSVGVALAAVGLLATAEVFADNSTQTLTPTLVHRDDLGVANARLQTGFITMNQLAGPSIGAVLFAAGRGWPFLTQAVLVAAGVVLIARVRLPVREREDAGERTVLRDVAEGVRWTMRHAAVRTLVLTILIFNFTFGAAWSVLVLYTDRQLGLGSIGYGVMTTVSALGGLLGTALYGRITRRVSLGNVMRIGLILETLTHLGLALTRSPIVAGAIFFLFGAHAFIWGTTSITIRQRAVPSHLQGRVGSVNGICVYGGLVVGSAIGGTLATHWGVTAPFWFGFAGSAVFVLLLWREMRHIAHTDDTPTDADPPSPDAPSTETGATPLTPATTFPAAAFPSPTTDGTPDRRPRLPQGRHGEGGADWAGTGGPVENSVGWAQGSSTCTDSVPVTRGAMTENTKQTSDKAASAASDVLRDPNATEEEKAAAGSALSQTPSKADADE